MSKQFWAVVVIIILVFVGIFALSSNKAGDSGKASTSTATLTNHVEGLGQSGVTLVEYGDYECPYCGEYFPTVKQVEAEFNSQITFQFRNFPLVSLHPNAFAAARAAEAAALQNKFWQMHDALYETQTQWASSPDATSMFQSYAQQLGLNVTQFNQDFASSKVNDLINADMAEGNKLQIQGTPTFFLDGQEVQVGNTVAAFETIIKEAIAKKAISNAGATSQTPAATPKTTTTQ